MTVTDADFVLSAFDVAVTVTCAGLGTAAGAVKRPVAEMVPQVAPEQPAPLRLHVTAVFVVPVTADVNCWVFPATTCAVLGDMVIATGGATVTVAEADFVVSATDVAVTVTSAGLGIAAGAVYRPPVEIVPHVAPEQPAPLRLHVTLVLDEPPTVAMNCCVLPMETCAVRGETLTMIECRIVTVTVSDLVESATEVAFRETCGGVGTVAGAV